MGTLFVIKGVKHLLFRLRTFPLHWKGSRVRVDLRVLNWFRRFDIPRDRWRDEIQRGLPRLLLETLHRRLGVKSSQKPFLNLLLLNSKCQSQTTSGRVSWDKTFLCCKKIIIRVRRNKKELRFLAGISPLQGLVNMRSFRTIWGRVGKVGGPRDPPTLHWDPLVKVWLLRSVSLRLVPY